MKKLRLLIVAIAIFSIALLLFLRPGPAVEWWEGASDNVKDFFSQQREIFTPGPLRGPEEGEGSLTRSGVIEWTNVQRAQFDIAPLRENAKLNASAALKVQDMFENQYFAHISPDGEGVGELAQDAGYVSILIGENLALGNFATDEVLVDAWMASPGHRENILKSQYTEIGVAVAMGEFEGRQVWLAVQHFAKPASACPEPSEVLLEQVRINTEQLEAWNAELAERKQDIENTEPKFGPEYNRKAREYNELVEEYNKLAQETEVLRGTYNSQVVEFNICIKT